MLMRSDEGAGVDCEDPVVALACLDPELDAYKECPAACRDNGEEDEDNKVVKSGDLEVTASANSSRKVVKWGVSDLDTLKFKTSEEVEITKVVLERYGYSTYESVDAVWLEDEEWNVIAEEREVNSKDVVTLSLKKDYRNVDGLLNATIVVRMNADVPAKAKVETEWNDVENECIVNGVVNKNYTTAAACEAANSEEVEGFSVGSTIGFKVTDVSSTAKNVDLWDYSPNKYDIVDYEAGWLTVSANPTVKKYNYEAKESYEIAKFKLQAGNAAVTLRGFTLENRWDLSVDEFVDKLTVTVDWKEVNGLKYNFNKDDELVISFDEVNVDIRKTATVVITAKFNGDFDEYGHTVALVVAAPNDVNAVESKTDARVEVAWHHAGAKSYAQAVADGDDWDYPVYQFNGSKVKLTNTKLGTIDAAQGAEGVVIASGEISLSETIYKGKVQVTATLENGAKYSYIDKLTLVINGEEYDSSKPNAGVYTFSNVEIDKSGKVQLKIDIANEEEVTWTIKFSKLSFVDFVYEQNKDVKVDTVGSITPSDVKIQAPSATLKNQLSTNKSVQYVAEQGGTNKVVFEGTYTAKKGDVYLNKFAIATKSKAADALKTDNEGAIPAYPFDRTFYVTIDNNLVGETEDVATTLWSNKDVTKNTDWKDFSAILVKAWQSVNVKVEADIDAVASAHAYDYTLYLRWEDENGNEPSGVGSDDLTTIKVVAKGTVTIPTASSSKNTVLKKAKNQTLATFTVKPSNDNEGLELENLFLKVTAGANTLDADDDYEVKVGGDDYTSDCSEVTGKPGIYECTVNEELPTKGLPVEVTLKDEIAWTVTLEVMGANLEVPSDSAIKTFTTKYASALVYLSSQKNEWSYTSYTLGVDKFDDNYEISDIVFGTWYQAAEGDVPYADVDEYNSINKTELTAEAYAALDANAKIKTPAHDAGCIGVLTPRGGTPEEDGDTFEFNNFEKESQTIECISYTVKWEDLSPDEKVLITTKDSANYFKVAWAAWRVFAKN